MDKVLFIYNAMSGNRSIPKKLDYITERFMEKGLLVQPYRVQNDSEVSLLQVLKSNSYSYIVVSGGDGTVNNIVNLMLKNNIKLPIGLIPSGTCNDFARSLNISTDVKKCIDIILGGLTAKVDVGLINNSLYFLSTCAGGIFVEVSFNTRNDLKKSIGPLAYYIKALTEVKNIKPARLRIETDKEYIQDDFLLFLIINGKNAGGFNNILDKADISDGYMDIILIKDCLHIDMPSLFFKVLANDFINDKNVVWLRTKRCHIESDTEVALSIDGEKGEGLPISIDFLYKAIEVFVSE